MNGIEIKIDKQTAETIREKYALNYLVLFGSHADGTARPDSDIDIAYSSKRELDAGEEVFLSEDIARALKAKKIDLADISKAGPLLRFEITSKGKLLAEFTRNSFDNFQIYSFMSYIEAKPLFRMQEEYVRKKSADIARI